MCAQHKLAQKFAVCGGWVVLVLVLVASIALCARIAASSFGSGSFDRFFLGGFRSCGTVPPFDGHIFYCLPLQQKGNRDGFFVKFTHPAAALPTITVVVIAIAAAAVAFTCFAASMLRALGASCTTIVAAIRAKGTAVSSLLGVAMGVLATEPRSCQSLFTDPRQVTNLI